MRNKSKLIGAAIAAVTLAGVSAQAATIDWDGGAADGGVYTNAINWVGDVLPGGSDLAQINNGDTVTFEAGHTNSCLKHYVTHGSSLNITGGQLKSTQSNNNKDLVGGTSGHSYLNQSGGFYQCAHILKVGAGALGTINLSGGCVTDVSRGHNGITGNGKTSLQIDSMGTLNITNATLTTRIGLEIAGGGQLYVHGGSSTITLGASSGHVSDGDFFQSSNAVLRIGISTNGLTPIVMENNAESGNSVVVLDAGAVLDVSFVDGAAEVANSWPVIVNTNGAFTNLGMVFDPSVDTNDWGFITSNNTLYVGYGLGWPAGGDVVGPPAPGRDLFWTGAGGDTASDNPTNWVADLAGTAVTWGPYDSDNWNIANTDVVGVSNSVLYTVDYDGTAVSSGHNHLEIGNGGMGILNHNSGVINFTKSSGSNQRLGVNGGQGTVNVNGGTFEPNAMRLGLSGGTGLLNVNGGTFTVARGYADASLWLGWDANSTGTVHMVGGRMFTRSRVFLGREGVGSIGIFSVEGSAVTDIGVGSNGSIDGAWYQSSGSILKCRVDAGGLTPIRILNKDAAPGGYDGNVFFYDGAILDIDFIDGYTGGNGSWDVMNWDGELMEANLAFAPGVDTDTWSFSYEDTNADTTNDTLRVKASGFGPEVQPDITAFSVAGSTVDLSWNSELGISYNVLSKTDLVNGSWSTNEAAIPGAGDTTSTTLTGPDAVEFYQIEAYEE